METIMYKFDSNRGMTSERDYPVMIAHCPTCDCNTPQEIIWQHMPKSALMQGTCPVCQNTVTLYRHTYSEYNPTCGYRPGNGGGK
jgi:hypothetical protein